MTLDPLVEQKPRALDLFCGAGGASMGLHLAGFEVVGVDLKPQPRYPFQFVQGDALRPPVDLRRFDLIWASPPCQAFTALRFMWNAREHDNLIPETRDMLKAAGVPYVIENVPGAPLDGHLTVLCGTMFGLQAPDGSELRRHRIFETSFSIGLTPPCYHGKPVISVHGDKARDRRRAITVTGNTPQTNVVRNIKRKTFAVSDAQAAMGIDWCGMKGLSQAIPPAYAEFIGRIAMGNLKEAAA